MVWRVGNPADFQETILVFETEEVISELTSLTW